MREKKIKKRKENLTEKRATGVAITTDSTNEMNTYLQCH